MRIHWAFAAALMSTTAFATALSVPAWAQEEEDVIVLDDGDSSAASDDAPVDTTTSSDTKDEDDVAPSEPGVTKLKRLIIGSDAATSADIVNQPAPVSTVDNETLRERMASSVDTAIRMTPGAYTRQAVEQHGITVNIRGMQGMGRVNQMIDGVPQTFRNLSGHSGTFDNMVYIDPVMLGGIDITRGAAPGSDGMGTLSGTANFKTLGIDDVLIPGRDVGGLVTLQTGTNGFDFTRLTAGGWRTNIGLDGSISMMGAISGSDRSNYRNGDGEWYPYDASEHPRDGLFKLNYSPDAEHSIELGAKYYENAFRVESAGYDWAIKNQTYTLKYAFQPGDNIFDLKVNAYYNVTDIDMHSYPGSTSSEFDNRRGTDTGMGLDVSNTSVADLNDAMSLKFFYGAGINSDRYAGNEQRGGNANGLLVKSGAFNDTTLTWGVLGLTAGLRYDYWSLQGKSCPEPVAGCSPRRITRDGGDWNPKIGITVDPVPWLQLYATYAHTMRPPTVQEMFFPGGHNFGGELVPIENNPNLVPERQRGFDIGVNLRGDGLFMSEDMAYLKVGYFRNRINNYITYATDPFDGGVRWVNLPGTTDMEGVELEGGYDAGVAYTRLSLTIADTRQPLAEFAGVGNDVGRLPDDYATLDAGLRFFERKLTLGGRVRYTGESIQAFVDEKSSIERPSYTLVDFYGSYDVTENAKLYFTVENAFDRSYFIAGSGVASAIETSNGIGRRVMIGATAKF